MKRDECYARIKSWYKTGLWDVSRVRDAVRVGWITEDEFYKITRLSY